VRADAPKVDAKPQAKPDAQPKAAAKGKAAEASKAQAGAAKAAVKAVKVPKPVHDVKAEGDQDGVTRLRLLGPGAGKMPAGQSYPPVRPVAQLFANGLFPEGQICPYLNE
jgi:hypothetical protein